MYLGEDFIANDPATDAAVGQQEWEIETIGNASTIAYLVTTNTDDGYYGVLRDTTAGTADGDGERYRMLADTLVLGAKGGSFRCLSRIPDITGNLVAGNNIKFGFYDNATPTVGVYVYVDSGIPILHIDSADHGDVSATAASVSTLTSGTTLVKGTWHDIRVNFWGANTNGGPSSAQMYVDGELAAELIGTGVLDNDEECEPAFQHWQDTGGADTLEWDFDFLEFFLAR